MDITAQDLQQLQQEAGKVENELRLRAIVAERKIKELETTVKVLMEAPKETS